MESHPRNFQDDLNRYLSGPSRLREVVASVSLDALDLELPDHWTIRQTVHHLADGDYIWKLFILMALGDSPEPFELGWYWVAGQIKMAAQWNYKGRETTPSLALFETNRKHTYELLCSLPHAEDKTLAVRWPDGKRQQVTIAEVIASQADHVDGHLQDVHDILDAFGGSH